jgi:GNAT superfamily N-acetyltransferase
MNATPIPRKLVPSDLPAVLGLSTQAGWNQTEADWRLLLEIAPDRCLGIEVDGELASTATLVSYGSELAWIGMVLTKERFRGLGFAKRLLTELVRVADQSGIQCVKLDATDQAQPLYAKLGFRSEQPVERWHASIPLSSAPSQPSAGLPLESLDADRQAFGADRRHLLQRLALRSRLLQNGVSFAMTRPGRICNYLGPCMADDPVTARATIARGLTEGGEWYWDLLPAVTSAADLARKFGFSPDRSLVRMVRGADLRGDERRIYALAGFELG